MSQEAVVVRYKTKLKMKILSLLFLYKNSSSFIASWKGQIKIKSASKWHVPEPSLWLPSGHLRKAACIDKRSLSETRFRRTLYCFWAHQLRQFRLNVSSLHILSRWSVFQIGTHMCQSVSLNAWLQSIHVVLPFKMRMLYALSETPKQ